MKKILILALLCSALKVAGQSTDEQAIRNLMNEQTIAWNKGDIPGFMKGYWQNDSLMFVGKNGITYGWSNTLEHYKKGYPDTAAMGKLNFHIIAVQVLSKEYAEVTGQWQLKRTAGDLSGYYTLLFRKIGGQWLIISDHTS